MVVGGDGAPAILSCMYREAARYYDVVHDGRGRDADTEADLVLGEIHRRRAPVSSLLDVACGTGVHLARFAERCEVVGVDLSSAMLEIAAERAPGITLHQGDFCSFALDRRFDAVVSLFSSIGYLTEEAGLREGIANLARHVHDGGVLLVEGWIEPEYWREGGSVHADSGQRADLAVARAARSTRDGRSTESHMRYVAATPDAIDVVEERHVMRLTDPVEMAAAFAAAGLTCERLPHMLRPGRSVYLGAKAGLEVEG